VNPMAPGSEPGIGQRSRIRVLVVDDSLDHRALIARRLAAAGMQVATASDERGALAAVDGVDLVLLDYRLPGSSGLDVLGAIRTRPRPPSVIMVTGAGSTDVAVAAMRAGAINYVAKDRGYLDTLPEVVERAWHHHDLAVRTAELQRLALLVTSANDRDQLFDEIVGGASRLLRASSAALLTEEDEELTPAASSGPERQRVVEIAARDGADPATASQPWSADGCLLVPLPSERGEPDGILAVWLGAREVTAEELELAQVFASFAGIALRNLHQFELERMLVTELQQTLDARRDFVASVSHELRTPLTSIAGFTATLAAHWPELDDERRGDLLGRIGRNAAELRGLVDDLLELASVERGGGRPPTLEPLGLHEQVVQTLEQLELVLAGRELRVDVPPLEVYGDASLLRRTLGNLLTNAVKFSPAGTPIGIEASALDDARVRVAVIDHGIGLPAWEASRVFDPFFRARTSVANAVRGSGIGLALVREYVRAMGGEVTLESVPGRGSTFAFTVPALARTVDLR
jgi:signal transduction histidine kinase/FixJ family two-component response regulator